MHTDKTATNVNGKKWDILIDQRSFRAKGIVVVFGLTKLSSSHSSHRLSRAGGMSEVCRVEMRAEGESAYIYILYRVGR